jgi:hypothetical protein
VPRRPRPEVTLIGRDGSAGAPTTIPLLLVITENQRTLLRTSVPNYAIQRGIHSIAVERRYVRQLMSALPPKVDIGRRQLDVRFVPRADMGQRLRFSIFGRDFYNVVSRYGSANGFECKVAHRFNCSNGDKARHADAEHSF